MKPWYRLNLNIENAITDVGYNQIDEWKNNMDADKSFWYWRIFDEEVNEDEMNVNKFFNKEFIEYMKNQGLPIASAIFFYRRPHYIHPSAHADGSTTRIPYYGINWVLTDGPDDSDMVWYHDLKQKPDLKIVTDKNAAGYDTPHFEYVTEDLTEMDRLTIGDKVTLVRVDVPHNIIVRDQARFVVSIRFRFDNFSSWEEVVEFFKPWIIE